MLETERLILRRFREDDLAPWLAHLNTPEVRAHLGGVVPEDEMTAKFARQKAAWDDGKGGWLAMERKSDGRVIGFCGVSRGPVPPIEGLLEIGWRMAADCWGQGYAREAAQETLRWIAANRPGEPVSAITSAGNVRSRRLMERLGMHYRPDMDFEHPNVDPASPLRPHVTYWLESVE